MAIVLVGSKISPGIAMGSARVFQKRKLEIPSDRSNDAEQELARFRHCHGCAVAETERMLLDAREKLGEQEAEILDAQLTLLQDEYAVVEPIEQAILEQGLHRAAAIDRVLSDIVAMFEQAEDAYLRERAADAKDVLGRLLAHALGAAVDEESALPPGTVLVAEELTPSDTIRMDLAHVVAIVTAQGGYYSHVGIISRNLGIPSVCGVPEAVAAACDGMTILVDGDHASVMLEPDVDDVARFTERQHQKEKESAALSVFCHAKSRTADGAQGLLCANIGSVEEAKAAIVSGAEGIGLLRSEFLYMNQSVLPDEQTQFEAYRQVLEIMGDRPVIIRTLDVGGDKKLPALPMPKEENPFLGCRAIRLCLSRRELFRTQLRALLRASVCGSLKIMFPMISSVEELRQAKRLVFEAREELEREGFRTAPVEIGIMIEIPSAALLADHLAREVDFFSIGTNDLIQYTVAAERGNQAVEALFSPYHPAVLRLIAMTAQAAAKHKILCGMCGEAASDPLLIPALWGMGIRELSMSAGAITHARKTLFDWSTADCEALAQQMLDCATSEEVEAKLRRAASDLRSQG